MRGSLRSFSWGNQLPPGLLGFVRVRPCSYTLALWVLSRTVSGPALRCASLQMGYLKKNSDGSLLYSVVNTAEPDADGAWPRQGWG